MHTFLTNPWFNAQFVRTIGHAPYGGADLGECFGVVAKLEQEQNVENWFEVWHGLATKANLLGSRSSGMSAYYV